MSGYVKVEHRSLGDARWLDATPEAFTVHLYALDYCNEQATDGHIPEKVARRLSCPVDPADIPSALGELLELELWERTEEGYFCPEWQAYILAAEEQSTTRTKWAADKRRQRLHSVGNHSLCTPNSKCPAAKSTGGQVDSSPPVHPKTSGRLDQTRPDPARGLGSGGAGARSAGATRAAAPEATARVAETEWDSEDWDTHPFRDRGDGKCAGCWDDEGECWTGCGAGPERHASIGEPMPHHDYVPSGFDPKKCDACGMHKMLGPHPVTQEESERWERAQAMAAEREDDEDDDESEAAP
ncbi:hypothetical protein GCM10027053_03920 [Intrasporangium mesophilum]